MVRALASRALAAWMVAVAVEAVCVPASLAAQATTVTLQGVITANDGSLPHGARIEVRNRETGAVRTALGDATGAYRVLGLVPGSYDIAVRAIGYRQQVRHTLQLIVGQRATLDFALERGLTELAPTVITAEAAFEVQRIDVSTPVLQEEIENLPLNSRNVMNLAAIAPGVRTFAPEGGRSAPAAGSLPETEPRFSNFYVDGVEWKGMYVGQIIASQQTGSMIPQEAVREFRVYLNSYDVEHTRGASHVISAITHSGGRTVEGSVFGFLQNRALVAKGNVQGEEPKYSRYQVGGNVRGPIIRDRLFFSASYEGQVTNDFIAVVPGRPTYAPARWDAYAKTFPAPQRLHTGLLRLTAPLGSHTLDATWATRHLWAHSGFGMQLNSVMLSHDAGIVGGSRVNSVHVRHTYTSPSLVNELSLHSLVSHFEQRRLAPGPTLEYKGLQFGRANYPVVIPDNQLRAINKTSYLVRGPSGQHELKAGVEISRVRPTVYRPTNGDGLFRFRTDTSSQPFEGHIAIGLADPGSTREAHAGIDGWLVGTYLQDQWQPVPSLSITAGLRWDAEINTQNQNFVTPWAHDTTLQRAIGEEFLNTGDRENDLDNFAPRVGVSWDALGSGRTFLRGGYGVMYDRFPVAGAMNERIATVWRTYTFLNPGTTDPAELRRRVAAGDTTSRRSIILAKDRMQTPENHQWSFGVGHRLTDHVALNLDYVNQRVTNTYVTVLTNRPHPVTGQQSITTRYGNILIWDDFGDARFDALLGSLTYDRRPTRLTVAYTLGWAKSEFGRFTASDYPDSAAYAMQQSEGDERHRLVISGMTALVFGLDLSGIMIVASPKPFLVSAGSDVNQNGSTLDDWPGGTRTRRRSGWSHWYRTADLRIGRSFPAPRGELVVTAEVFNLFSSKNHSEYRAVESQLGYGNPVADYAPRQAQLGVRYRF